MKRITSIEVALIVFGLFALSVVPNAQAQCYDGTLEGSFALVSTGDVVTGSNPGPRAVVGVLNADGWGDFSGFLTKSSNGTISRNLTVTGTYTVNSNCTGSATFTDSASETRNFDFVIFEKPGGDLEVVGIQTDDGHITTFTLKTQSAPLSPGTIRPMRDEQKEKSSERVHSGSIVSNR
jgi:hypothetical protein